MAARPDLASRLDAVFGLLGNGGGPPGWCLTPGDTFKSGKSLDDCSSEEEEEEEEERCAPRLPGSSNHSDSEDEGEDEGEDEAKGGKRGRAGGADEDDDAEERRAQERFAATCSAPYRKAFEAEAEEDEFDRLAVGPWTLAAAAAKAGRSRGGLDGLVWELQQRLAGPEEESKPAGSMQVLDDNVFDRLSQLRSPPCVSTGIGSSPPGQPPEQLQAGPLPPPCAAAAAAAPQGVPADAGGGLDFPLPAGGGSGRRGGGASSWAQRVLAEAAAARAAASEVLPAPSQAVLSASAELRSAMRQGLVVPAGVATEVSVCVDVEMEDVVPSPAPDAPGPAASAAADERRQEPERRSVQGGAAAAGAVAAGAAAAGAAAAGRKRSSGTKTVRFREQLVDGDDGEAEAARSQRRAQQQQQQQQQQQRQRGGARRGAPPLDWQRRGFVPDYVKHPQRYTVYTLDEPLTVGSFRGSEAGAGRGGGPEGARPPVAEARQRAEPVAVAGESGVEEEGRREPLVFGSGAVQFRRRGADGAGAEGEGAAGSDVKRRGGGAGGVEQAVKVVVSSVVELEDAGLGSEDAMVAEGGEGGVVSGQGGTLGRKGARGGGGMRRQFRSRQAEAD